MIKKSILCTMLIVLLFTISCAKSEEQINEDIQAMTINLIELDWKLHNLKITYEDYYKEAINIFTDDNATNQHIEDVLNPLILENVESIDQSTIEKYRKINYRDYDMPLIKVSKVYTEELSKERNIFINAIVSPYSIQNIYDTGVVFVNKDYSLQEERNIHIKFVLTKKNKWRIESYEGNAYLLSLKESLSTEFINEYTTFHNTPVEYTKELKLINQ